MSWTVSRVTCCSNSKSANSYCRHLPHRHLNHQQQNIKQTITDDKLANTSAFNGKNNNNKGNTSSFHAPQSTTANKMIKQSPARYSPLSVTSSLNGPERIKQCDNRPTTTTTTTTTCDKPSNGIVESSSSSTALSMISHLFSAINCVIDNKSSSSSLTQIDTFDSSGSSSNGTISKLVVEKFYRLIDTGKLDLKDLVSQNVRHLLLQKISENFSKVNGKVSHEGGAGCCSNRILLHLLQFLEDELQQQSTNIEHSQIERVNYDEIHSTAVLCSSWLDSLTEADEEVEEDVFESEDNNTDKGIVHVMGRKNRKKNRQVTQTTDKVGLVKLSGKKDALVTDPAITADRLMKIIDKWHMDEKEEVDGGGDINKGSSDQVTDQVDSGELIQKPVQVNVRNEASTSLVNVEACNVPSEVSQEVNLCDRTRSLSHSSGSNQQHYSSPGCSSHYPDNSKHNHKKIPQIHHYRKIINFMTVGAMQHFPGPNEAKLMDILNRSGYCLELSNGQRKYCPAIHSAIHSDLDIPAANSEIFIGRIPKDIFEDELIPLFETVGKLYDLRLMIDPISGSSRGYAFVTYFNKDDAMAAVQKFDNYEIRYNKTLKVKISIPNVRLFVGNIPKEMSKEDIYYEFYKQSPGLVDVIVYHLPNDRKRNRGFCFLEFETHKQASHAKRKLISSHMKVWGAEILIDWAEPLEEPDQETMSKVKVLYVRNLQLSMCEEALRTIFEHFGPVDRVKKIKDYAFVHFERRDYALNAMETLQGKEIVSGGMPIEISLAKPPSDKKRKEEILRNRERRLMNMMQTKSSYMPHHMYPSGYSQAGPNCSYQSIQHAAATAAAAAVAVQGPGMGLHGGGHYHHNPHHHHSSQHHATFNSGAGMAPALPSSQIVSATLQSTSNGGCASNTGYYQQMSSAQGAFQQGGQSAPNPSPSAVARVTLGAQIPPPPYLIPILNGHQHHRPSHYNNNSQQQTGSTSKGASVSTTTTATTGSNSSVTTSSTMASNKTIYGPQANMQSTWNWYNWYEPNWWYAANCAANAVSCSSGSCVGQNGASISYLMAAPQWIGGTMNGSSTYLDASSSGAGYQPYHYNQQSSRQYRGATKSELMNKPKEVTTGPSKDNTLNVTKTAPTVDPSARTMAQVAAATTTISTSIASKKAPLLQRKSTSLSGSPAPPLLSNAPLPNGTSTKKSPLLSFSPVSGGVNGSGNNKRCISGANSPSSIKTN